MVDTKTPLPDAEVLRRVLRGPGAVRDRRVADAQTAERKLLRGDEMRNLSKIILDTFDLSDLKIFLRYNFDVRLEEIVPSGSLSSIVFGVLEWAQKQGITVQLIKALANDRPARAADFQELLQYIESKDRSRIMYGESDA
jgi:hypothetical protein